MGFTLEDLGLAYRKAKVDLYYSTTPSLFAIADYEDKLQVNLTDLQERINGEDQDWIHNPDFLGGWSLVPKAIKTEKTDDSTGLIFASPDDEWQKIIEAGKEVTAEFRLMACCSLDFHVLSALWMLKVGSLFDKKLSSNVYGSRLRRNRHDQINELALGSFTPYLKPFRDWRDGGINAMRSALQDKKEVLALTADVSSFFHELNPGFMQDPAFIKLIGVELDQSQTRVHQLFITALEAWAKLTPLGKGLPVGLPASAVVANAALFKLDQFIEQQVVPLYYGRYVDDILLVMENTSKIKNTYQFWDWIFNRDGGKDLFKWEHMDNPKEQAILFKPDYLETCSSRIVFTNNKNKLFVLSGAAGIALVNAISEQINQRASEWRSLPNLPDSAESVATDLLKATSHIGEQADNLRKTDALTLHRASFALNLRDYEAYERDLPPDSWKEHRHAFFDAVTGHLLTPIKFFELAQYLPRIIRMAVACEDFSYLGKMIKALNKLTETVKDHCTISIKALQSSLQYQQHEWWKTLYDAVAESIISSFPHKLCGEGENAWDEFCNTLQFKKHLESSLLKLVGRSGLQGAHTRLFSYDLAHIPLRFIGLPKEMVSQRGIVERSKLITSDAHELLHGDIVEGIRILVHWLRFKRGIPAGLNFATRPFSLNELYLIAPDPFNSLHCAKLSQVMQALRGFELTKYKMPHWDKSKRVLQIPDGEPKPKHTIAVSSWETSGPSFVAAVMNKPDPDSRRRYQRLSRLINELISRPDNSGYLILPELALPPQWFIRIAHKLKGRGISFISGVEYLHAPKKRVLNQVWASLSHDGLGFPSLMLYRQDKQRPALHEEQELFQLAGLELIPATQWTQPPVVQHGDFRFAMMICSELTNIRYRADLRGKVDALFVPEWNPDTDTFNALVESAALDIHAYIIQCNNRLYGDSRIRAPYKERYQRDLMRVKGGNHDYCITGEIDITALRQFQSSHRSPGKPFKPVPDGFALDMAYSRKESPKGDS
ncbi:reverse transcriptase domain-containing protein [Enterobacter hormaechei]|uniref:reverse transcriptase domain-containing protein n=1 Tax=Enterobacter hormaechei TaxID=158836 RepID=UPI00254A80FC|nr:reverse transcriptase domain-containing protein [Enterobacter hormaechei]MEC5913914.1 reverse transcriptase domain-containing protein [Enterobacter hormaechei]